MAQVKLVWTRLAISDLNHAYDYIAAESPFAAVSIIDRIEEALRSICQHPGMGRPGRVRGTRELIVIGTPFIIPYRVKENRVELLAVIHGARQWPESF